MRRISLLPFLVAAIGLSAQEGTKWVTAQGAYIVQDSSSLKDDWGYGLGLGTWFSNRWGMEFSALNTELKAKRFDMSGRETHAFLSGLMNLNPGGTTWFPYLRAGLGGTQLANPWSGKGESTTRLNLHGGVGVQAHLAENFLFTLEARAVRVETDLSRSEYQGIMGIGYRWGGAKPVTPQQAPLSPAPEPVRPEPPVEAPKPVEEPKPVAPPVPAPAPSPAPEPPKKFVLDEAVLHFANGKSVVSTKGADAIRKVAHVLKSYPGNYTLKVSGHTSSTGKISVNRLISKRRADAVSAILKEEGIPADRIQTVGVGPDQPLADNKTLEGQAKNRRVEIDVNASGDRIEKRKVDVPEQVSAQ
jgi:OOP family OmpA-OmpF porin